MHELSYRIKDIRRSVIADSLKILERKDDIISLGAGEPDFKTPPNIIEAAKRALEKGYTHYSPYSGNKELKEAIARKLKKENDIDVDPAEEVIVTCGSKEAINLFIGAILNPGDEAIVPDPGYLGYRPIVTYFGGKSVGLRLKEENNFEIDADELKKAVTDRTRLLIINSPSNPMGSILSKKNLEEIADVVVESGLFVISDEAYEKIIYDGEKHVSMASLDGMKDYVVTSQTFSKAYAMCGFRVGYAAGKKDVVKPVKKLKIATTLCAPVHSQIAAIEALEGKETKRYVDEMVKEYDRRRKFIVKRLNEMPGIICPTPKGAFYTFPNITGMKMSSDEAYKFLLEKAKVLTIPGAEFGENGEGYLRIGYATNYNKIAEAMDRIGKFLK